VGSVVNARTIVEVMYELKGFFIQGVSKLSGKTSGMDASYREMKKRV
jgi:hypothetical protein